MTTPQIDAAALQQACRFPVMVESYAQLPSTQTVLKQRLRAVSLNMPLVVVADQQTAGYGKFGRHFYSPAASGLYFSLALPEYRQEKLFTLALAVVIRRRLQKYCPGNRLTLKWVNDLMANDRKVGGILVEKVAKQLVCGVGINLSTASFPGRLGQTAGALTPGAPVDCQQLMLELLDAILPLAQGYSPQEVATEYRNYFYLRNKRVRLLIGRRQLTGRAISIDDQGALLVRDDHGELQAITSGEVLKVNINSKSVL